MEQLFSKERDKANEKTEAILAAWRKIAVSPEGEKAKDWLMCQVLKPVGATSGHQYYAGTQDAFKLILELMKQPTKGVK
jgi:hypothetical protein